MSKKRSRYERRRGFVTFWPSERTQTFTTCRDCGALVNGHEIAKHDEHHSLIASLDRYKALLEAALMSARDNRLN